MYYKRRIDSELVAWKNSARHKPLLLRGARQVGKSSAVRELGKSFEFFIEVNLERNSALNSLFGDDLDIKKICVQLSAIYNTPIVPGKTLLFIDEIQTNARAIASLRFFYEQYPELHVIAAGSLLEFALRDLPSFGVGRIHSLFLYPFSFDEFLDAAGKEMILNYKRQKADCQDPLPEIFHQELVSLLRVFYLIGGMPEVVSEWLESQDYKRCHLIQNDIMISYQDDFKKYKSRIAPELLKKTMQSVARQAGGKFVFSHVDERFDSKSVKQALSLLSLAGLVIPVTHTSANGIPLGAETNEKYQKYLFLDVGLMQTFLDLSAQDVLLGDGFDFVNKGGLSEVFAGLELIKYQDAARPAELYYWQREEKNAQAEVDYVVSINGNVIPIEVKASRSGSMQSLHLFMKQKKSIYGIRTSLENFSSYDQIKVIPLYALSKVWS